MFDIEKFNGPFIAGLMLFLGVLEIFGGLYKNSKRTKDDWWIEILSFVHASTVSKPMIILVSWCTCKLTKTPLFCDGTHKE